MKVFVVNMSDAPINEHKPGIGAFFLPPREKVEIKDFIEEIKDTSGKVVVINDVVMTRVRHTALELAQSLARDRQLGDVQVIVESDAVIATESFDSESAKNAVLEELGEMLIKAESSVPKELTTEEKMAALKAKLQEKNQ